MGYSTPKNASKVRSLGRRLASLAYGLIALCLIATATYTMSIPRTAVVPLHHTQLTSSGVYDASYTVPETYGGTNPIDTCTGCDFWGRQDTGTATPPSTNPADMVNSGTGDVAENYTLFSESDPGFNLQVNLSYDALWTELYAYVDGQSGPGPYGWGWRTDASTNVKNQSNADSLVSVPGGAIEEFYESTCPNGASPKTVSGSGATFCAADRIDASFGEFNNYATYQLDEHGGRQVVTYNFFGQVQDEGTLEDPNAITFNYGQLPNQNGCPDPAGASSCTVVSDQLGRYYADVLNSAHTTIEVQDPNLQAWGLGYDANGNLVSVTDPNTHAWGFGYDTAQPSPYNHDLTALSDPDANTTRIAYVPAGNTNAGLVSFITDATGQSTNYIGFNAAADDPNNSQWANSYVVTETDPDGTVIEYQYTANLLGLETVEGVSGDPHYVATTQYDLTDNVNDTNPIETIIDPNGNRTIDYTDEVGNLLQQANHYGTSTTEYNSFDEPCWSEPAGVSPPSGPTCTNAPAAGSDATFYTYDAYGNQTEVTDPTGVSTYTAYNTYGYPCWQTTPGTSVGTPPPCSSPPAASTSYNYNAGGELLTSSSPDGYGGNYTYDTTTHTYNPYGEVLTEVTPDGNVSGGTPANYTTTNYYDNAGRLYKVVAPMGRTTTAVLDAAGNVDSVTDPAGEVTSAAYDADNRTCWKYQGSASSVCGSPPSTSTRYTYNANTGDPLTVEDPNSNTTHFAYGNPDVPNHPTTVTDALGNITSNVYDLDGNVCVTGAESTSLYGRSSDPSCGATQGYTYDTFDQLGNVMSTNDPSGNTTTYARNDAAFPGDVSISTPPSGGSQAATNYGYDLDGRPHTEVEGNGNSLTITYTPTGRECWQAPVDEPSANCISTIPTVAGTSAWSYYYSQLPLEMGDITPSGGVTYTAWAFDAQGQETKHATSHAGTVYYAYNYAGDNTCVAYPVSSTSTCSSQASSTNTVVNYGYNNDGQMTSMSDWLGNSFSFGYDARSNLTSIDYPISTTWTGTLGPYDAANNLTQFELSSPLYGTAAVGYSHNADELYSQQVGTSYNYDPKLRVTTAGTHTFGYNPNGEVASDTPSGGAATNYSYNPDGTLTSNSNGTTTMSYAYDGNGNRCATLTGSTTPSCSNPSAATSVNGFNAYNQLTSSSSGTPISPVGSTIAKDPTGSDTSLAVTLPSGTVAGDQVIVGVTEANGETSSISGFTAVGSWWGAGGTQIDVYHQTVPSGETSFTVNWNTHNSLQPKEVEASVFSGVDPNNPVDVSEGTGVNSTKNLTLGSLTTTQPNDELVLLQSATANTSAATWSAPSMTEATQSSQTLSSSGVAYQALQIPGATGPESMSVSNTATTPNLAAALVALRPATTTYSYDGDGLRVSDTATTGGTSQNFVYNTQTRPGQPLIIEDGANAYLYGPANFGAGTAPVEQISLTTGVASYLVSGPTGLYELWTSTGARLGTSTYSTYGTRTVTGTSMSFGFQGAYTDPSGLLYLIGRYYDPATDQFLSVDPLLGATGQPYAFTGDDPLNATDPRGLVRSTAPGGYDICADGATPQESEACHQESPLVNSPPSSAGTIVKGLGTLVGGGLLYSSGVEAVAAAGSAVVAAVSGVVAENEAVSEGSSIADDIASGHAYEKHVIEQGEYPNIASQSEFKSLVQDVIDHWTESKALSGGRYAYWQDSTQTVVITDPANPDAGTAFRPANGIAYYLGLR